VLHSHRGQGSASPFLYSECGGKATLKIRRARAGRGESGSNAARDEKERFGLESLRQRRGKRRRRENLGTSSAD